MKNSVGKTIKKAIFDSGLSHKKVASLLGVTQASISLWENGRTTPSNENIEKINKLFGVSINVLSNTQQLQQVKNKSILSDEIKRKLINTDDIALIINTARHIYNREHNVNMSQEDLAKRVGLNAWAFSKRMVGKTTWKISELKKVAKLLNLKTHFLIFGSSYEKNTPKITQSEIYKSLDSNGNTVYTVEETESTKSKNTNDKVIKVSEQNEFKMFMKFKKFMEAQNDND